MNPLPSPAVSPAPSNSDANSPLASQGRKRARSSDSSVTSSSKRAMSEDPTAATTMADGPTDPPRSQSMLSSSHTVPLSNDDEIDAYMLDQEARTSHLPQSPAATEGYGNSDSKQPASPPEDSVMSPDAKYARVTEMKKKGMVRGEVWYVVSHSWFRKWEKACTGELDKEGGVLESQLGAVDNSDIVDDSGKLKGTVREGEDVEYVPLEVWKLFTQWYGEARVELPRSVIARGIAEEALLELFPPSFDVCLLEERETTFIQKSESKFVTISCQDTLKSLYERAQAALSVSSNDRCRLWQVENLLVRTSAYPTGQLKRSGGRKLPESDDASVHQRTIEELLLQDGDTLVLEAYSDNKWMVDEASVPDSSRADTDSSAIGPLFSSGSDFFSQLSSTGDRRSVASSSSSMLQPSASIQRNVTTQSSSSAFGKGKMEKKGSPPGTVGLSNMGNTCFMNSALQCLVHMRELAEYFLADVYRDELNVDNPLGMGGAIAEAFGALMERLWTTAGSSSFSPREFKLALQRFAPQFSGYQQHDSQELVAFLLDGLHEDLNRVLKKPYVEKPDWEGGGDKELVELARVSWEGYMKRNDSVIVDLFQGQYRSTLVCPTCEKVSITFDPYMYLTLPLPIQKKWTHNIYYVPWDNNKPHVKVTVDVNRNASFKDVRRLLGRWMDVDPDNLLTLETFSHRFYKNLHDNTFVNEMQDHDVIVCFELPCHAQQSRSWKPDPDPSKNPLIIPVHLTKDTSFGHTSYARSGFAHPFVIVISHEDAHDKQRIYAAVIERLERWTENSRDLYQWEEEMVVDELRVSPNQIDSLVEIKENGDVIAVDVPEEGDIVDERSVIVTDESAGNAAVDGEPVIRRVGPKPDLFEIHIQRSSEKYVMGHSYSTYRNDKWNLRANDAETDASLLHENDALFCEWDDNFRTYYFGDDNKYEHGLWTEASWKEFVHPELTESREAANAKKGKGITLLDCLEEFTREEQLGEDDLWYCPRCKDHKQATKKFDIWTVPDILVVHLKRFSNSRILRDKIDAFVDFPVEGLDLGPFCVERQVAEKLAAEGANTEELGLRDLDEPLIYDLYAVDEHLGGLGGGHYRAYAKNHVNGKWYHFDDSYVTPAEAMEAVNANAYLLFYKRRTERPLGGTSFQKLQAKCQAVASEVPEIAKSHESQLPTPPDEAPYLLGARAGLPQYPNLSAELNPLFAAPGDTLEREDDGLPMYDESQLDERIELSPAAPSKYEFPDPSTANSPSSSNEAEWDGESDDAFKYDDGDDQWRTGVGYSTDPPASQFDSSFNDSDAFEMFKGKERDTATTLLDDRPQPKDNSKQRTD